MAQNVPHVHIRQANELGRVHAAKKTQMKETYCGRPVNEEEWLITSKEVTCTVCARAEALRRLEGQGEVPSFAGVASSPSPFYSPSCLEELFSKNHIQPVATLCVRTGAKRGSLGPLCNRLEGTATWDSTGPLLLLIVY